MSAGGEGIPSATPRPPSWARRGEHRGPSKQRGLGQSPARTCCVALSKLLSLSGPLGARLATSCLAPPGTPTRTSPASPAFHSAPPGPASGPLTLQERAVAVADGRRDVHEELPSVPEHQQGQLPVRLLDQLPGIAQRQVLTGHPVDLKGTRKEDRT